MGLHERLETVERLQDIVEWLPTEIIDLGLDCLVDAILAFPTSNDPMAVIERTT